MKEPLIQGMFHGLKPVFDIPSASQIPVSSSCYSADLFFFHYALAGHKAFSEFTLDGDDQELI